MKTNLFLFDSWILSQREKIHLEFQEKNLDKSKQNCEKLVRQALFKMKMDKSPFFRARIYCDLLENPKIWREIRKKFRKFLLSYRKYRGIDTDKDFIPLIYPEIRESLNWHASQFITWGIIMPDSILKFSKPSCDYLINLYGSCIEKGHKELKMAIYSTIIEKFTGKNVDNLLFSPFNKESNGSDFYRLYSSKYIVTTFKPDIMDWLFSQINDSDNFKPVIDLMKYSLGLLYSYEIEDLTEEMEDICSISFKNFALDDINELSEIIIFIYWNLLSIQSQLDLLNEWSDSSFFINYLFNNILLIPHMHDKDFFKAFYSTLEKWGYYNCFNDIRDNLINFIEEQKKNNTISDIQLELYEKIQKNIPDFKKLQLVQEANRIPILYSLGDIDLCLKLLEKLKLDKIPFKSTKDKDLFIKFCGIIYSTANQFEKALLYFGKINKNKNLPENLRERYVISLIITTSEENYMVQIENLLKDLLLGVGHFNNSIRDFFWDLYALKGEKFVFNLLISLIERKSLDNYDLCNKFGHLSADLGFFSQGVKFTEKALEFANSKHNRATALNNIGTIFSDWGKYDSAIEYFKKSLEEDNSLVRGWNNLGKVYSFMGENIKTMECMKKVSELNPNREASLAEYYFTQYEASRFSLIAGIDINFNVISNEAVILHFKTADILCDKIFPQNEEIQSLASAVFMHYGTGMELLFNQFLGIPIYDVIQQKYNEDLKMLSQEKKKQIPRQLHNLLYKNKVGLGSWASILRKLKKNGKKGLMKQFSPIVANYSSDQINILKRSAQFFAKYRNPSSHGEIFSFSLVRKKRMEIIFKINLCLEVFSQQSG